MIQTHVCNIALRGPEIGNIPYSEATFTGVAVSQCDGQIPLK